MCCLIIVFTNFNNSEPTLLSAEACDVLFALASACAEHNQATTDAVAVALSRLQSWHHTRSPLFSLGVSYLAQVTSALQNSSDFTALLSLTRPPKDKIAKAAISSFIAKQSAAVTHNDVAILALTLGRLTPKSFAGLFLDHRQTLSLITRVLSVQPTPPLAADVAKTIVLLPGLLTELNVASYLSVFVQTKSDDLALHVSCTYPKQASDYLHSLIESDDVELSHNAAMIYGVILKANQKQFIVSLTLI